MSARGEYEVPRPLRLAREIRAEGNLSEAAKKMPPSLLYARCEEAAGSDATVLRALYLHAMVEIGFVGEKPEPNFAPFVVCPICGYVF